MRRLYSPLIGMALLAALTCGCGSSSSSDDELVFRFVRWNNVGLTQQDSVGEASANVDVVPSLCRGETILDITSEEFTETVINAVFRNSEGLDIRLTNYRIHFNQASLGDINLATTATIVGGRCSADLRPCAVDGDCRSAAGIQTGFCDHQETNVSAILLFDFQTKRLVDPDLWGQATDITVTFYGTDLNQRSFQTTANYTVTFDDFCSCESGQLCISAAALGR